MPIIIHEKTHQNARTKTAHHRICVKMVKTRRTHHHIFVKTSKFAANSCQNDQQTKTQNPNPTNAMKKKEKPGGGYAFAELSAAGQGAFVKPRVGIHRHAGALQVLNVDWRHYRFK